MPDGSTCADERNAGKYITNFDCKGVGSSARMLKEMRLSFPSGHSSFTFYTMVYVAVSQLIPKCLQIEPILITPLLAALFARPHDVAWVQAAASLSTVPVHNDCLVHCAEPRLGLQASLVRCAGWLSDWCQLCAHRGKSKLFLEEMPCRFHSTCAI